jgi:hypothetical protein|tara:strand:- start:205 stop:474 length:270 start_codon:yes stop_codon:yes gene_type:complete
MRILATLSLMFMLACSQAQSGHSQNNDTCDDDILHWSNMINKRTDAPLHARSLEMASLARKATSVWKCETFMEEAIRMIRKTDGEYPTE